MSNAEPGDIPVLGQEEEEALEEFSVWLSAVLENAPPMRFWQCHHHHGGTVTWQGGIATCDECGMNNQVSCFGCRYVRVFGGTHTADALELGSDFTGWGCGIEADNCRLPAEICEAGDAAIGRWQGQRCSEYQAFDWAAEKAGSICNPYHLALSLELAHSIKAMVAEGIIDAWGSKIAVVAAMAADRGWNPQEFADTVGRAAVCPTSLPPEQQGPIRMAMLELLARLELELDVPPQSPEENA